MLSAAAIFIDKLTLFWQNTDEIISFYDYSEAQVLQNKDIEIFLELVSSRNVTKAAEHLYMSQSVVSTRLKKLEEELGYELFLRSKGMREMELTRQGSDFVSIAVRWHNLFEEADLLRAQTQQMLRLAAPESVYYDYIEPLILLMMTRYPNIRLSVQIADSSGIYDMMDGNAIDFGFASYESARSNIVHSHIYDQSFCVVSYTELDNDGGVISPAVLEPSMEVRLSGGNFSSIHLWRDKWFGESRGGRIEINSPHMMVKLLREPGTWALLPVTSAEHMKELYGMRVFSLSDSPESRKIYLLRHEHPSYVLTEAAETFLTELKTYIESGN